MSPVNLRNASEIERIAGFARSANDGLIVTGSPSATVHRNLIITLAARHKLPAVYSQRAFAVAGGLISYGPDFIDQYRRAAGYVDRILKGEKPTDLPVQAPTRYELVINLKTARMLGLTVPPMLLARPRAAPMPTLETIVTAINAFAPSIICAISAGSNFILVRHGDGGLAADRGRLANADHGRDCDRLELAPHQWHGVRRPGHQRMRSWP